MFNVVVEIKAPEIVEAIKVLTVTLAGTRPIEATLEAVQTQPAQIPQPQQQAPQPQVQIPQPVQTPQTQPQPQQQTLPGTVPTAAQTYTMEQLAVAATQLVDAGRREDLVKLLSSFGVQALTMLPKEQYGNFATALRQMGAQL